MPGKRICVSKLQVEPDEDGPKTMPEEKEPMKGAVVVREATAKEVKNRKNTDGTEEIVVTENMSDFGKSVADGGSRKRKSSAEDCKASNTAPAKTPKNKKSKAKVCMEDCVKGAKSGCPIKMRRRKDGHLSCAEIHEMLISMGIEDPLQTSKCVRAAIMKGHIKITGNPEEMEMIICEGECKYNYFLYLAL